MKVIYEGTIDGYSFQMVDRNTIEVWSNFDNERPESFIFLRDDTVKNEKDFHKEISYWYMENVG